MGLIVDRPLAERWRASFAWSRAHGGPELAVRRFRRRFALPEAPDEFVVHVSADSRYRLWVNGQRVGRGPLKGTLAHYAYETYDLAAYLRAGENAIAAEVCHFGADAPTGEVHSARPGLLFQGPADAGLDTPGAWAVQVDRSLAPDRTPYIANAHRFQGYWERVDVQRYPRGWTEVDYDDGAWEPAVSSGPADVPGLWGESSRYQSLVPRDLPALVEEPRAFAGAWLADGARLELVDRSVGWELDAGEGGEIVLDAGALTTAYPVLRLEGGAGRTVEVVYGECLLRIEDRSGYQVPVKEVRDDRSWGDVHGYRDTLALDGEAFCYEPFHWRTFWYVKIVISSGPTPVALREASYRFTTYPQELRAAFAADLVDSDAMWEISWRTLQLCAHETYEDCPYYEQLNYVADSRLQALCSLVLAGETALPRRTIRLFRDSVRPDGLVCSRVPSVVPQILPYFALIWVLMVADYWEYVGPVERAFVRSNLHVVDGVLWFFRERLRDDGFVGLVPPWNMVDRAPGWERGEPPAIREGGSTYLTCLYIHAMDAAVRLHSEAGEPGDADRWRALSDALRAAVRHGAWSEREGLYLEGPGRTDDVLSQHSQALAILSGAATGEQRRRILSRLTSDPALHRMQFMQSYYLARALEVAGGYEAFDRHVLSLWREALGKRVSTWPEYPDPTRSDCHAWSSWIAADFIRCGLGIRPYRPGFEEILIAPCTEIGAYARGSAPTPMGQVRVEWRQDPVSGVVHLEAETPAGVPTRVRLPGQVLRLYRDGGRIVLSSDEG
ncbi:MAG: alpha-L-rhamnosidase N-terminal domain-containing protein [Anaerolineae bacterium]|nr:alpha-L-rhamnosidase N-terminal domain-containing protein [Anaerolineae bacterium]